MGRRLLAAVALAGLIACDSGIRVVGYGQTAGSTGGGGTGGGGSNALVGVWRSLSSLLLSTGETMILDVRWSFGPTGSCERTRIQTIVDGGGGSETTETIGCTYVASGSSVTVTFVGVSVPSTFSVAFSSGDLILNGTRFDRIG